MSGLILSLFPGIGLLDKAFEENGFCIVRGPDLLWGGDIRNFHMPPGVVDGVIGGPPCQAFSQLVHMVRHNAEREPDKYKVAENLIPEFERVIEEAAPRWFLMENVPNAPDPVALGYSVHSQVFNNRWCGGVQNRTRKLCWGTTWESNLPKCLHIPGEVFQSAEWEGAVLASGARVVQVRQNGGGVPKKNKRLHQYADMKVGASTRSVADALRLQGLPEDFFQDSPLTIAGKQRVLGNGVPLPLGRAIAEAVAITLGRSAK